jgi:hypothetical protein
MQKVPDSVDTFAGQQVRNARADALYILYGRGEFKHAQDSGLFTKDVRQASKNIRSGATPT